MILPTTQNSQHVVFFHIQERQVVGSAGADQVCAALGEMVEEARPQAVAARKRAIASDLATAELHNAVLTPQRTPHLHPEHPLCQVRDQFGSFAEC